MSKYVAPKNKSFLTAEITYSLGDKFSKMKPQAIMKKVKDQVGMTGIVDNKYLINPFISLGWVPVAIIRFESNKRAVLKPSFLSLELIEGVA